MKPHSNKLSPSKFHRKASNLNQSMATIYTYWWWLKYS